jgi:hypothetical protein
MDVLGPMIVWIDHHPYVTEPQNGGHIVVYQKPKRFGICPLSRLFYPVDAVRIT